MISKILGERSHAARSVCVQGEDDVFSVYQLLGMLLAHRVPVSLSPLLREVSRRDDLETLRSRPMIRVPIGRAPREIPLPSFLERAPAHSHTMSSEFSGVVDAVPEPISHFNEESGSYHAPTQEFVMPKKVQVQQESAQVLSEQWSPQPAPMAVAADPVGLGMVQDLLAQTGATAQAHEAYLAFSAQATQDWVHAFQVQSQMMMQLMTNGQVPVPVAPAASYVPHPPVPVAPVMPSYDTPEVAMEVSSGVAFDRDACMEFAIGSVGKVLGPMFAEVDNYPVRVRLPDEPLMLVDRIVSIEGEKGSMTSGSLVTEHDVHPGSWYLDGDCTPVCISVEAGQADLFLCSYLGIDLKVKGKRAYRLLDAEIHFHRELPRPGECIRYDISIEKFVRQGDVYLFFFQFDGTIDGQPLLTMRNGCAGFFTPEEVQDSGGILLSEEDCAPCVGKVPDDYRSLVPFMQAESYDDEQIEALRQGDIGTCFGPMFGRLPLSSPVRLPGGKMRLLHRVLAVEPHGGRFGLGFVRAQADIRPDDWFLTCHFVDDMVMPGTLMYECCAHTLRVLLMRMGWVGEHGQVTYEPVPGVRAALRCRGPVTRETKHVFYEVEIKEIGTSPEPYVIADAIMYADDKRVVSFRDMSMRLRGTSFAELQAMWRNAAPSGELALHAPSGEPSAPIYDTEQIMAYAVGRPSEGFGPTYRMFDDERIIARLPGPPYLFLDRVTAVEPMPWDLRPSGWIEGEYEVPADAWYFLANRQPVMPFGVLLEIVLQPCGWLAAYLGSGLHGKEDLSFRNLGGEATLTEMVGPDAGLLTTRVRMTHVSKAGGMIIQKFAMQLWRQGRLIYDGKTEFGFFTKAALSQQVGIVGANEREYVPTGTNVLSEPVVLPMLAPLSPDAKEQAPGAAAAMPGKALQMLDEVEIFEPEGGTNGLGFLRGVKYTDPDEWFFKAHFYQDPVCPGSLGLESFLQLLKYAAIERWGETHGETHIFEPIVLHAPHRWVYRGQILPRPSRIEVNADITEIVDGDTPMIKANGFLKVDGLFIYEMIDFGVRLIPKV
jgi:3-hydroxymyristoyl/3-hydroxydecanoyl-(acyl carrier protein) dehydratase